MQKLSEQAKKIQEYLASKYGIFTREELMLAIEKDEGVDVGIFVNAGETGGKRIAYQI